MSYLPSVMANCPTTGTRARSCVADVTKCRHLPLRVHSLGELSRHPKCLEADDRCERHRYFRRETQCADRITAGRNLSRISAERFQVDATPGTAFAVDSAGGVYAGGAADASFKPTPGASSSAANSYAIVRLNAALTSPVYATYSPLGKPTLLRTRTRPVT